ncbi:hypothetical protein ANHYDRO_00982 [Anaerococcus hydrogenalis DSM 7454]|uniref:Uncharacterized protein n=1 Tax=Anaerococcus hydrogenalis DSM 7454 TaxID=561177 RepID=B6W8T1_9FIRM|nr:hypothetical protein [Anaerococcus hydrogenalis]EEB36144.1 hypothetical protein ANHYDRO_00982 [Anaerococcus hydrogenalis DSM 7454]
MKEKRKLPLALVISLIPILVSIFIVESGVETYASLWALLPPVVAIVMALITKEVYSSLFFGNYNRGYTCFKKIFCKSFR